ARRRRPARFPRRQVGEIGPRLLLLLLWGDAVRGALQELEDVLFDVRAGRHRLAAAADQFPLHACPEHQARPVRAGGRRRTKDGNGSRGSARRAKHRLYLQLEHAPDRPAAVAQGTRELQDVSTAAGSGELQPRAGYGATAQQRFSRPWWWTSK